MEPIFIYFIKAGLLIFLFLTAYYLLLRKETFFKSNRWFLLFGLVISVVLPVVTFKKTVWIDPAPVVVSAPAVGYEGQPAPAEAVAVATIAPEKNFEIDWFWVTLAIYGIGILALLVKFALDFYALKKVLKGKQIHQQEDYKFVNVKENIAPFSYFNYIVYNPELYSEVEMQNILEHEKVHCSQNHTIDVLIARLFCIAFWWNPFVWFYKKAIVQNLEFIADSDAFKNISDKKAYQFTLLKITTHESCVAISNHFFQSLIKKRIVMLNKNQSKRWNSWKYAIIVPALAVFMWQFQVKVVAQEKKSEIVSHSTSTTIRKEVTAKTTDAELKELETLFKEEHNTTLKFSKVKRNKNGEIISLKAVIESKGNDDNKGVYQVSGTNPIASFTILKYNDSDGKELLVFGEANTARAVLHGQTEDGEAVVVEADDIAVASYYTDNDDITPPNPPTPPAPPAVPNYPTPPTPPDFPTPPTPPNEPQSESNKKAWAKFEEQMKKYEAKMGSIEMKKWEKEIEEYAEKIDAMQPDTEEFDKGMQQFDKEMKAFEEKMKVFEKQMQEFTRQVQQEVRADMQKERGEAMKAREEAMKEREEARGQRDKERAEAEKYRAEAKKEREKAQKEREAAKKK
ncbi:M56 family metallopeptidase [Flavobacterium soli]|uniref:M56 family metallopeptidase n=1 Tax=Flavobacterium soli TaxID=344881 RepID=UPI00040E5F6B|nr:M56 family metallopeptidase [Flavobacterium soli]